jgi:hypothetical protein
VTGPGAPETGLVSVYDADEASVILRCKASWLKAKARERKIPFTMIGGAYRWTDAHLAEIIRLGEVVPAVPAQRSRRSAGPAGPQVPLLQARPPRRARSPDTATAGPAPPVPAATPTAASAPLRHEDTKAIHEHTSGRTI